MDDRMHRGSYTVEASLLMSVILMVLFLILRMNLFLTDQVRMSAVLAEDCTYTSEEIRERNVWFAEARTGFFLMSPEAIRRSESGRRVSSAYTGGTVHLGYGRDVDAEQSFAGEIRDPVKYLRRVRLLKNSGS